MMIVTNRDTDDMEENGVASRSARKVRK